MPKYFHPVRGAARLLMQRECCQWTVDVISYVSSHIHRSSYYSLYQLVDSNRAYTITPVWSEKPNKDSLVSCKPVQCIDVAAGGQWYADTWNPVRHESADPLTVPQAVERVLSGICVGFWMYISQWVKVKSVIHGRENSVCFVHV